jgi:NhaP-type Na+/H+ or K+/H+ antiporter
VQSPTQLLPPSVGGFDYIMNSFMEKFPTEAFLSVLIGTCLGFSIGAVAQRALNVQQANECRKQPDTHRLVTLSGPLGDAKHCIHARYLAN